MTPRAVVALALLAVAGAALAQPKPGAAPAKPKGGTAAPSAVCLGEHQETAKRYLGSTSGASSPATARVLALADARRRALADLCVGELAAWCDTLGKYVHDGDADEPQRIQGAWSTCGYVTVRREGFDALQQHRSALQGAARRAAERVKGALPAGAAGVYLADPAWPGGCNAATVGATVQQLLRRALLDELGALTVRRADASHVVEVALSATVTDVAAEVRLADRGQARVLDTFTLPKAMFEDVDASVAACRAWGESGLDGRPHDGTNGLGVSLSISATDHDLCAGERFELDASVRGAGQGEAPPDIVLLSVPEDGDIVVMGRRPGPRLVAPVDVVAKAPEEQEALVALAVPRHLRFRPTWDGPCKLPAGSFRTADLPPEIGWAQLNLTLRDTGNGACTDTDPEIAHRKAQMIEDLASLPYCGD